MKKQPRDYQIAGANALWSYVHTKHGTNPLVLMPTGSGKSLTMAMFIAGMVQTYPHLRFLSLTHVKELVAGNYRELLQLWPTAPAGVYSAGLRRKEVHAQITFAGIASIGRNIGRFGHIDFVVVDEAHRISDSEKSGYQKVFAALRQRNPNLIVIGFTATGFRMGTGVLTDGSLFDEVCFDLSSAEAFVWMIQQRYLLRLVSKNPGIQVDETKVRIKAGEYDEKSASEAFREQDILERAVDIMIAHAEDEGRQAWLTFAQSIDDAELLADMFQYKGYPVEAVHSKRGDRDDVLERHRRGELIGVVNKDVLTTGYDDPRIDLIGILRLTRSPGLWVQMLGRGTRPLWTPGYDISTWEGRNASILASPKQNCRVLDFAGNILRLGPINYPTIPKRRKKGGGGPPVRECPECGTHNHISLKCCEECGFEFPVQQKLKEEASSQELVVDLNNLPPPKPKEYGVFRVDQMIAAPHKGRNGKPDSMRVDYFCGVRRFSKWVCLQHAGFPRTDAERWWRAHAGKTSSPPATVQEGVERFTECHKPHYLKVWVNAKYPEIEGYDFEGLAFELPPELGGPPVRALERDAAQDEEEQRVAKLAKEMFDDEIPF